MRTQKIEIQWTDHKQILNELKNKRNIFGLHYIFDDMYELYRPDSIIFNVCNEKCLKECIEKYLKPVDCVSLHIILQDYYRSNLFKNLIKPSK